MTQPRIMFAGGGDERDSRSLDETFAGWLGKGRLLYLPSALVHPSNKTAGYRWIQNAFAPLGVTAIDAWMDLTGKSGRDLARYDAIYISGGNTFFLLQQIRAHHLDQALDQFIHAGKPVYGGSAGAIILGYDITSCAHIDENIIGLTDFTGLDLALGYTIWCHYQPADAERIQAYVRRTGIPSIALSEKSGVYRLGDHLYAAGSEPPVRYTLKDRVVFSAGEQVE
jgi:dipeptidase E